MKLRTAPCITLLLALLLLSTTLPSAHAVVYVKYDSPGPTLDGNSWATAYHSVQPAINDAATAQEEVWVAKGTYTGTINLASGVGLYGGFAGTETSRDQRPPFPRPVPERDAPPLDPNETILDGNWQDTGVTGQSDASAAATIDGFTITHCARGIHTGLATLTIRNNLIRENYTGVTVMVDGGGIYCGEGAHIIEGNFFRCVTGGNGGGIYCLRSSARISGNTFMHCDATYGAAVYLRESSSCTVTGNTIDSVGGIHIEGGVICCDASSPVISGNTIRESECSGIECLNGSSPRIFGNTISEMYGDGIVCRDTSSPTIRHNSILHAGYGIVACGNTVVEYNIIRSNGVGVSCSGSETVANNLIAGNENSTTHGGGIVCTGSPNITNNTVFCNKSGIKVSSSTARISNNIVAYNSSGVTYDGTSGVPLLRSNCVYGNHDFDYSGLTAGIGDISLDPKLASVGYCNLHIQPDSPCANAGWSEAPGLPATDMDGQTRMLGGCVDIGADETDGVTRWPDAPVRIVRVRPDGNDANDGSSWELAKCTIQVAADSLSLTGGEVWAKSGTYADYLMPPPFVHLYGGFVGTETERSQRDWKTNHTVIDPGSVWLRSGGNARVNTVDGFAICNGSGVQCSQGMPLIANNTITGSDHYGIYCSMTCPEIRGCTIAANAFGGISFRHGQTAMIADNVISDHPSGVGIEVYGYYGASPVTITGNTLTRNSYGAIYCEETATIITDNTVVGNTGRTWAGICVFGGIYSESVVSGNLVAGNHVTEPDRITAGGIACFGYDISNVSVIGNTVVDNDDCGLRLYGWGLATVADNIVAHNQTGIHDTIFEGLPPEDYTLLLRNNCVYGNTLSNYDALAVPGVGDISADPLFVDRASGDYHLTTMSPCVNAGWNAAPHLPSTDIDGEARIQGTTVDIGSDECWLAATGVREAKRSANGILVSFTDAIVTAAFDGFFYIEAEDRSSGVRVEMADHGVQAGDRVDVTGSLKTNADGERYIEAATLVKDGTGSVKPLAMNSFLLGGGDWFYNPATLAGQQGVTDAVSLNNIGLLVTTWGRLSYADGEYTLSAGIGRPGVKVLLGDLSVSGTDPFVKITGISSCYRDTDGLHPVLRATGITPVE